MAKLFPMIGIAIIQATISRKMTKRERVLQSFPLGRSLMQDFSLEKIDAVRLALEQAATVQEVKEVLDTAKAAETYARQVKSGKEIELKLSEYIIRAQRKLGEILKAAKATGQITFDHGNPKYKNKGVDGNDTLPKVKLSEARINRDLSSRAQKLASIPEKEFEQNLAKQKEGGKLSVKKFLQNNTQPKLAVSKRRSANKPPHYREAEIEVLFDRGLTNAQIAEQVGCSIYIVLHAIEDIKIRRGAEAQITPEMLSLNGQQKLERAIARQMKRLGAEYELKIEAEVNRRLRLVMERWQKQQDEAKRVIESRKAVMTKATYKKILVCLHPDWIIDPKQKTRYEDAFIAFSKLEKLLLDEKDSPTKWAPPLPKTPAEWAELKRKAAEAAKAKREQSALAKARQS